MFATGQTDAKRRAVKAFTLVELILVMTILTVVISVAAPSMSGFFRGRTQDYEARQFLSMIRYGQSRAVSEGVPTQLWIDEQSGEYGLELEPGYTDDDTKAVEFTIDKNLTIKVERSTGLTPKADKLPTIHCLPDGSIAPSSPVTIVINEAKSNPILIVLKENGLSYEIQNDNKAIQKAFR